MSTKKASQASNGGVGRAIGLKASSRSQRQWTHRYQSYNTKNAKRLYLPTTMTRMIERKVYRIPV